MDDNGEMMDENLKLFLHDLDAPQMSLEERAELIADVVASGSASDFFLRQLAEMIRPNGKTTNFRFRLEDKSGWFPRRAQIERVGYEMRQMIDFENVSGDEAVYQMQKKYGVKGHSRSACFKALKAVRTIEAAWSALADTSPE